jgi:hypothetical protein
MMQIIKVRANLKFRELNALLCCCTLWVGYMIDPAKTRKVISEGIAAAITLQTFGN